LDKAEKVIVGGIVANDILKERGYDIKKSQADINSKTLLEGLDPNNPKLILPVDFEIRDGMFRDIGPKSIEKFSRHLENGKLIVWNGPLGYYENPEFAKGTNALIEVIVKLPAYKVAGGGDTITAIDKIGLLDKFDFVSTGGGAMLKFLAEEKLPGLEALN